jgi:pimeloyl-ACP methyl ester carboxylesterase
VGTNQKIMLGVFCFLRGILFCQTIYLFSGQGSDERIFGKLKFDSIYKVINVKYPEPQKGISLAQYARSLKTQIDTTEKDYIFIGVSMGGMICSELCESLHPKKVIVISSAKCRGELPLRYRFQKTFPIYKIIPPRIMKWGARILQPIVEPDRNKEKEIFKSMLKQKSPTYYKRTVAMIIRWDKKTFDPALIHIHGSKDHTLPLRRVKSTHIIEKGSHMMTLTRADTISVLLNTYLR